MILGAIIPQWRTIGEVDNPDSAGSILGIFPSNANSLVRISQLQAIAAFVLFPEESILDVTKAIELFPRGGVYRNGEARGLALSSTFRFIQGILSILAVLLLVMTSAEVDDIIFNFTAINMISRMDE